MISRSLSLVLFALLPFVSSCSDNGTAQLAQTPVSTASSWVVAWGNSPENALSTAENPGGSEQSFRSLFLPTIAGTQERVHFSNLFGTTAITVGAARLAVAPGGSAAIDATHDVALSFSGNKGVTIQPGQEVFSDTVNVTYTFGQKMAVSFYVQGTFPPLTQHESQVTTNFATPAGAGDQTADSAGTTYTQADTEWYLVTGMDVYGSYQGTVAVFGSSSIDGHNSNLGDTNSYPTPQILVPGQDNDRPSDWLARQLNAAGYHLGVLNAGTIGDPAGPNSRTAPGSGTISGVDRMNHDVLQQPNIKAVVIYFGGIDIRSDECKSAPDIEGYLTQMVTQAHTAGVRVILATLPPGAWCSNPAAANYGPLPTPANPFGGDLNPGPENPGSTQRRLLNDWIRATGPSLPGVVGIADFDKVLAYPAHPDFMLPNLNSGDNFHPNGTGYGIQSAAIPLASLLGN